MRFTKSILKVGRRISPDGVVDVTPERLKHWAAQFKRLKKESNVPMVPIGWDHATTLDGLMPLSVDEYNKRRSAKNTVGHLADFKLARDGQSAELVLEVGDDQAIDKAKKNLVAVSPVIVESFKDGKGNEYKDVITHVDFVNHPVDSDQGPFVPEAPGTLACALRMGLSTTLYRLSDDDSDDDDSPADDDDSDNKESADSDGEAVDDEAGRLKQVIEALGQMNIVLSPDTNTSNLLAHLHQALLTAAAHRGEDVTTNDQASGNDTTEVADPGIAALSLQTRSTLAWAEKTHRENITKRLEACLNDGRCTPAEFKARKETIQAVKLSLDAAGQPAPSKLEEWLDSRDAVPRGTFWDPDTRTKKMASEASPPPPGLLGNDMDDQQAKEAADWALGRKKS